MSNTCCVPSCCSGTRVQWKEFPCWVYPVTESSMRSVSRPSSIKKCAISASSQSIRVCPRSILTPLTSPMPIISLSNSMRRHCSATSRSGFPACQSCNCGCWQDRQINNVDDRALHCQKARYNINSTLVCARVDMGIAGPVLLNIGTVSAAVGCSSAEVIHFFLRCRLTEAISVKKISNSVWQRQQHAQQVKG